MQFSFSVRELAKRRAELRGVASVLDHTSFNAAIHPCKKIVQSEGEQDREKTGCRRAGRNEEAIGDCRQLHTRTWLRIVFCTDCLDDRFKLYRTKVTFAVTQVKV
jgi:hypothetical protein